jgi:DNA-binding transcriptional ArsR family regulator
LKTLARPRDKAEILRRLRDVRPESVRRWGRMSAHQMVCHLSDALRMGTGRKPVSHATSLLQRTIVRWVALYLPVRWPAGILTRPEIEQELAGTRPIDFAADVAQLETLLELVTAPTRTFDWQVHPIFGRMSDAAWLRWGYLHIDHHLRQFGA